MDDANFKPDETPEPAAAEAVHRDIVTQVTEDLAHKGIIAKTK